MAPTFANINLLGKCNVDCFFCLGKDLPEYFDKHNHLKIHFINWKNFSRFLQICKNDGIKNIYITGQNTDALLYKHLHSLIFNLQFSGFDVGIRTNGYQLEKNLDKNPMLVSTVNLCKRSVGISIHTLDPDTNMKIMGTKHIPDWDWILPQIDNLRISVVINRYNHVEVVASLLAYLADYKNVRYIQLRKVSTDTRYEQLEEDMKAFDLVSEYIHQECEPTGKLYDADVFEIMGKEVVLWPTVSTSINSYNYFTDGIISKEYFVIEGYLKNKEGK
jgi:molybdenum cofactor biosynthesis enzyme MoaA